MMGVPVVAPPSRDVLLAPSLLLAAVEAVHLDHLRKTALTCLPFLGLGDEVEVGGVSVVLVLSEAAIKLLIEGEVTALLVLDTRALDEVWSSPPVVFCGERRLRELLGGPEELPPVLRRLRFGLLAAARRLKAYMANSMKEEPMSVAVAFCR